MTTQNSTEQTEQDRELLISPRRAAQMLDVSRSQIDRLAMRFGWSRIYLNDQKRGSVRFRVSEILAHIKTRTV